jgi:hypothetical protein
LRPPDDRSAQRRFFLDTNSAARFLGLQPKTLDRWRWAGCGPRFRKHGRRVVYATSDLLAWSEAQASAPTTAPLPQRDSAALEAG